MSKEFFYSLNALLSSFAEVKAVIVYPDRATVTCIRLEVYL